MSDALHMATPERVAVEIPIAGLGSRAMAYAVDASILSGAALVVYFALSFIITAPMSIALGLSNWARLLLLAAGFFGLWVYWTLFEALWQGQSLGKRLLRIRVVQTDGSPVTIFSSAIRNLIRIIDFLPVLYAVGIISMLIDSRHRRLGDLLAGTILVRDERIDLSKYEQVTTTVPLATVSDLEVATQYLARFSSFEESAQLQLGRDIAQRLGIPDSATLPVASLRAAIAQHLGAR